MLDPRSWRHPLALLAGCGLLAALWFFAPIRTAAADDAPAEATPVPVEGILVMRTGAVVSGKIVRLNELYQVIGPYGDMQVPVELVKLRCADLQEAYTKLHETAKSHHSANAQITLARWCLTHHLDSQARQELQEALLLEPDRDDAKRLLRDADDSLKSTRKKDSPGDVAAPIQTPRSKSAVVDESVTLGGLSREQALQFTRRIQPLLVNTCSSAGCHSRDSQNGFRLQNVSPGKNANRNATERNLAQVLEHIDIKKPQASSLLTTPGRHHGRNGRSVFAGQRGDEQFAELEKWVMAVAGDEMQRAGHNAGRKSGAATVSERGSRTAAGARSAAATGKQTGRQLSNADPFAQQPAEAAKGQTPVPPVTGDPFDPSGFNRANDRRAGR